MDVGWRRGRIHSRSGGTGARIELSGEMRCREQISGRPASFSRVGPRVIRETERQFKDRTAGWIP